jgi:hypothetical protein
MLDVVQLEVRNEDVACPPMGILPGNEGLMKSPAKDVQSTAGSRKTALSQGWGVYLSLENSKEAPVLLWAIVVVSSWSVEVLDSEVHKIGGEMAVNIVKMLVIADAHLHVSSSQSVVSL